jgi:uncharacterized membrane protein
MYDASVALHVVAALVGFGATFSYPVIQLAAERRRPDALPLAMETILAISRYVAVPATLVVGVTGVYQLADGPYGLDDAWAAIGLGLYLAVMLVSTLYLVPCYRRAARAEPLSSAYRAAVRGPMLAGPLVAAAVLATVVLMELKPG